MQAVRRFVVSALEEWNLLCRAQVVLLLTSELATDALLHARTGFQVTTRYREGESLRVEVQDGSTRRPGRAAILADTAGFTLGRRLKVVRDLASSWGAENHPDGTLVWFEVPVPAVDGTPALVAGPAGA